MEILHPIVSRERPVLPDSLTRIGERCLQLGAALGSIIGATHTLWVDVVFDSRQVRDGLEGRRGRVLTRDGQIGVGELTVVDECLKLTGGDPVKEGRIELGNRIHGKDGAVGRVEDHPRSFGGKTVVAPFSAFDVVRKGDGIRQCGFEDPFGVEVHIEVHRVACLGGNAKQLLHDSAASVGLVGVRAGGPLQPGVIGCLDPPLAQNGVGIEIRIRLELSV